MRIPILCIGMAEISSRIIFGFFFLTSILTLSSYPTVTAAATDHGFNKLFTHNRTANPFHDSDTSFLSRLRDLTAAGKKPRPGQISTNQNANSNGRPIAAKLKGANKQPQFVQQNGGKIKKNKGNGNGRKPKPKPSSNHNNNPNHNYYSSSYAIPKLPPVDGASIMTTVFTPTVPPTRIHPLAVLKTEIKSEGGATAINYGRSALDDLLGAENVQVQDDQEGRSSEVEVLSGPAASDTNFFKNFRDHSEDPMAEESAPGPAPAYALPPADSSVSAPSGPPSAQFGHHIKGQYSEMYPQGQGQTYTDHRNVNYWPQKLNSYYGDEYLDQMHHANKKRPGALGPSRYPLHVTASFEEYGDEVAESTNALRKVTMIDRISTFYTDYKLLAWIGIVVLASLAALFSLLVLYWRNPPTEVVTARDNLSRTLTDPTLVIFVSEALRKFGEKEKIDEKHPGGKRRRPKKP